MSLPSTYGSFDSNEKKQAGEDETFGHPLAAPLSASEEKRKVVIQLHLPPPAIYEGPIASEWKWNEIYLVWFGCPCFFFCIIALTEKIFNYQFHTPQDLVVWTLIGIGCTTTVLSLYAAMVASRAYCVIMKVDRNIERHIVDAIKREKEGSTIASWWAGVQN